MLEEIVLEDIRDMAKRIVLDEKSIREEFIRHNAELADAAIKKAKKELQTKQKRVAELSRLMQVAYEDRVKGKMPEEICIGFIEKYSAEQKTIAEEIEGIEKQLAETETTRNTADDFICDIKKYLNALELTREMCYELIDRIVIGGTQSVTGKEREIDIVYKVDIASVLQNNIKKYSMRFSLNGLTTNNEKPIMIFNRFVHKTRKQMERDTENEEVSLASARADAHADRLRSRFC